MTDRELMQQALEALEFHVKNADEIEEIDLVLVTALRERLAQPEQRPVLQDIEQYRMQMAGISTAAIGYWKEGDDIHPDYDTVALRDVAKLYAKYDALYKAQPEQEPVAWMMKSTIDWLNVAKPNGYVITNLMKSTQDESYLPLYTTPPQRTWVGLTDEEIDYQAKKDDHAVYFALGALWAEAKLKEKNHG